MNRNSLFWAPRGLAIVFIAFISLFALDVFAEDYPMGEKIVAFLIHLLPTFILVAILIIAWKWEQLGGLIFIALGVYYLFLMVGHEIPIASYLILPGLFFIIGILFLFCNLKLKPKEKAKK